MANKVWYVDLILIFLIIFFLLSGILQKQEFPLVFTETNHMSGHWWTGKFMYKHYMCTRVSESPQLNKSVWSYKYKNDAKYRRAHQQTAFNTDVPKWINHAANHVYLSFQSFLMKRSARASGVLLRGHGARAGITYRPLIKY